MTLIGSAVSGISSPAVAGIAGLTVTDVARPAGSTGAGSSRAGMGRAGMGRRTVSGAGRLAASGLSGGPDPAGPAVGSPIACPITAGRAGQGPVGAAGVGLVASSRAGAVGTPGIRPVSTARTWPVSTARISPVGHVGRVVPASVGRGSRTRSSTTRSSTTRSSTTRGSTTRGSTTRSTTTFSSGPAGAGGAAGGTAADVPAGIGVADRSGDGVAGVAGAGVARRGGRLERGGGVRPERGRRLGLERGRRLAAVLGHLRAVPGRTARRERRGSRGRHDVGPEWRPARRTPRLARSALPRRAAPRSALSPVALSPAALPRRRRRRAGLARLGSSRAEPAGELAVGRQEIIARAGLVGPRLLAGLAAGQVPDPVQVLILAVGLVAGARGRPLILAPSGAHDVRRSPWLLRHLRRSRSLHHAVRLEPSLRHRPFRLFSAIGEKRVGGPMRLL
jgi:hypothetical protein